MIGTASLWLIHGEWRAHPARLVAAILAIAVGVALGYAVHLVNRTALDSFARAVSTVSGGADLQVRAVSPAGFDENLYPRLARLPGLKGASPVVSLPARSSPQAPPLTLLGLDMLRAARLTPALVGQPVGAFEGPLSLEAVYLSRAALAAAGLKPGDTLTLTAAGRSHDFRIAGVLPLAGDEQHLAVIDIAEAQWRFGQLGRLTRIDLALADAARRDSVIAAVTATLPGDAELLTPEDEASRSASLSRAYRVNLGMLAMVALITGGFLVYSAQSLSVARRLPHFALLRVLGQRRSGLRTQLLVEGLALGLAGSLSGLALGHGLASAVLAVIGGDLGGGYFRGQTASVAPAPGAALGFAALGLAVAVLASLAPAEAAARAQPAVALKAGTSSTTHRPWPLWPALGLFGLAALAAAAPPIAGLPLPGYAAMALLLAGGLALMPWLTRALLAPLIARHWPLPLDLAIRRLWGAPSAAAVALAGIVASTSLMVAMAVMIQSFRGSVDEWLVQLLPADIYLHVEDQAGLDRETQARLASLPGIASVRYVRQMPLSLKPGTPPIILSGQPLGTDPQLPLIATAPVLPGARPAWISEPMALLYDLAPGDTLTLPLGGGQSFRIAGIWRDYAHQFGAVALDTQDFEALTGDTRKTEAGITLAPDTPAAPVMQAIRDALPAAIASQTVIAEPRTMRSAALAIFDKSFAITYALEAIAILIGLFGIATALSAQTLARVREFGMLRHIGVKHRQIIAMLAAEGAALGTLGTLAGLGLGLVMAQVLIQVINPQSFHWTMDTRLPWPLFAGLAAAIITAAAGTAILAGRRALSPAAIHAVRDDW